MADKPVRVRVHVEAGPEDRQKADEIRGVVDALLQAHGLKRGTDEARTDRHADGGVTHRETYTR